MLPYRDLSGGQAVVGYTRGPRSLRVTYANGQSYLYSWDSAGQEHVEAMKQLAIAGQGLTRYIREQRPAYEGQEES